MRSTSESSGLGKTFRAVLEATAVSNLGDGVRLAALPLLATNLTDSPILVAAVTAAQFLPWLVFGPFGGVIVDRADRRRLILTTQAWRGLVMLGLAAAVVTNVSSIWMVLAVAFVITVGEILVDPSVVAVVPTLVDPKDLDRANGRISSVEITTNELIGAPVGAGLFAIFSWIPFLVDGVSYLGSILLFRQLPQVGRLPRSGSGQSRLRSEVLDGARWLWRHPMLKPWTVAVAIFNVGSASAFSLLVLLVLDTHNGSEAMFGLVLAGAGITGTVGSGTAARLATRFGRRSVLLVSAALLAATQVALAAAPTLIVVIVAWSVGGGLSGVMLTIGRGFIQRYCPNEMLGRAAIASRTVTRTAFVVGAVIGGVVAAAGDIRLVFALAGGVQALALVPMARALRHDQGP